MTMADVQERARDSNQECGDQPAPEATPSQPCSGGKIIVAF